MFGHPIRMNFDGVNPSHNTKFGGLFSILVYMVISAMIISKTIRVVTNDNPDMNTIKARDKQRLKEEFKYNDMSFGENHIITYEGNWFFRILDFPEIDRYVHIYYELEKTVYEVDSPVQTYDYYAPK